MMTPIQTLFAVLVALNIVDVYTTARALALGAREANPVMRKLMDRLGIVPALLLSKAVALGILWWQIDHPWMPYVLSALCALYVYVVANNMRVIRARGGRL